ncbi:hypothetical protein [Arthrobacter castelli]|uniref:hypothetical protein n=1 Tax=Arthrobacter castelli TaxID=271431 RepID=UPI00040BD934|nr:hypothetical protein [Arthrobacter castelli]
MSILDSLSGGPEATGPDRTICSRKACRAEAEWQLLWNNPKIHTPDRRKIWVACDEHAGWLQEFLTQRGLWKETLPLNDGER